MVRGLGISCFTVLLVLALLELPAMLGVVDYRRWLLPAHALERLPPWDSPLHKVDQDLVLLREPGVLSGETDGDLARLFRLDDRERYPYEVHYDRTGFRNERDLDRASIAVVGDSMVEAPLVPREALLSSRLGAQFGVDVANLGRIASGPQHELSILRRYGLPLQPRVVLWLFFEGNDLGDADQYARLAERGSLERFWSRSFLHNALTGATALADHSTPLGDDEGRKHSCQFKGPDGTNRHTLYFWLGLTPPTEGDLRGLDRTKASIAEGRDLAAAQGAQFALVYVPTKFRVYRGQCVFAEGSRVKEWTTSDLPGTLASWARDEDIPFLNLTPALREAAARRELVYLTDDTHWNAAGNAVAAEALARFIVEHGWLDPGAVAAHP